MFFHKKAPRQAGEGESGIRQTGTENSAQAQQRVLFSIPACDGSGEDFKVLYHTDTHEYSLEMETLYAFDCAEKGPQEYVGGCLERFTDWMQATGRATDREVTLWQIFQHGDNVRSGYRSLEELYAVFRLLACGALSSNLVGEE